MTAFLGQVVMALIVIAVIAAILASKSRRIVYTDEQPQRQRQQVDRSALRDIRDHELDAQIAENQASMLLAANQHYLAANQMGIAAQHRAAAAVLRGQMGGQR
ncbi:MAG TPA: hypothetical protein VGJ13_04825 [Pseudonocardiaceae bacterium]|jgi:hypothetical protein